MNDHYTYLLIDAATIAGPIALSFDKKVAFYRQWRFLWLPMVITAGVFIAWDTAFNAAGIWWFSDAYTLPYRLLGLPVEEWIFFITVPYACCFISACIDAYFPPKAGVHGGWTTMLMLAAVLILFAVLNYQRDYTLTACGGCGVALFAVWLMRRKTPHFRAARFLITYAVCLIPFLLVNGLLTALPVVCYNVSESTGIRIYTIPLEDVFYGMLLVLGNIWGLQRRRATLPEVGETSAV